jgi:hypothetical protein
MQPYQRASQAIREGEERPLNLLKNFGLSAAGGGAANLGSKAMSKIVPSVGALISKYVPDNILTAGLSRLNPKLGTFMQGALEAGYSHDDIREFLGEKVEKSQEQQVANDNKNLIEKHSPELHQFIEQEMKKGQNHLQAGARATLKKEFGPVIEKLKKEHKTSWEQILEAVYGGSKSSTQNAPPAAQPEQQPAQPPQQAPQNSPNAEEQAQFIQELKNLLNA